ncbi:MAG: hypothetical protein KAR33_03080 [Candidatus Thorarchaeota archaeon]|nr:hypothetical protein [Candidatus Thorarchaeota archaeon]
MVERSIRYFALAMGLLFDALLFEGLVDGTIDGFDGFILVAIALNLYAVFSSYIKADLKVFWIKTSLAYTCSILAVVTSFIHVASWIFVQAIMGTNLLKTLVVALHLLGGLVSFYAGRRAKSEWLEYHGLLRKNHVKRELLNDRVRGVLLVLTMLSGPIAYLDFREFWWGVGFYGFLLPFGRLELYNGFRLFYSFEDILILTAAIRLFTTFVLIVVLKYFKDDKLDSRRALFITILFLIVQIIIPWLLLSWRYRIYYGYLIPLPTQAILALILVLMWRRNKLENFGK